MKIIAINARIQKSATDTPENTGQGKNKPKRPRGRPGKMATFPLMMASQKEDKIMMTIKVNFKDDYTITRINGTLEEVAEHYFSQPDVESIDVLDGVQVYENEYLTQTLINLYRVSPEEQKEFDLYYNIRAVYKIEYKPEYKEQYNGREESCGFLRIA